MSYLLTTSKVIDDESTRSQLILLTSEVSGVTGILS